MSDENKLTDLQPAPAIPAEQQVEIVSLVNDLSQVWTIATGPAVVAVLDEDAQSVLADMINQTTLEVLASYGVYPNGKLDQKTGIVTPLPQPAGETA